MLKKQTINREYLAKALASEFKLKGSDAYAIVSKIFEMIISNLKSGNTVRLSSLGVFSTKEKPKRVGRNPKTGVLAEISARTVIRFQSAPALKARMNENAVIEDKYDDDHDDDFDI